MNDCAIIKLTHKTNSSAKKEFNLDSFHQVYSKVGLTKLPLLSKALVDKAVTEMESDGYQFSKRKAGSSEKYAITIENS
ncbi:TPA: hypothetical protein ACX6R4_004026 [Photobacterium damselae]